MLVLYWILALTAALSCYAALMRVQVELPGGNNRTIISIDPAACRFISPADGNVWTPGDRVSIEVDWKTMRDTKNPLATEYAFIYSLLVLEPGGSYQLKSWDKDGYYIPAGFNNGPGTYSVILPEHTDGIYVYIAHLGGARDDTNFNNYQGIWGMSDEFVMKNDAAPSTSSPAPAPPTVTGFLTRTTTPPPAPAPSTTAQEPEEPGTTTEPPPTTQKAPPPPTTAQAGSTHTTAPTDPTRTAVPDSSPHPSSSPAAASSPPKSNVALIGGAVGGGVGGVLILAAILLFVRRRRPRSSLPASNNPAAEEVTNTDDKRFSELDGTSKRISELPEYPGGFSPASPGKKAKYSPVSPGPVSPMSERHELDGGLEGIYELPGSYGGAGNGHGLGIEERGMGDERTGR